MYNIRIVLDLVGIAELIIQMIGTSEEILFLNIIF